MHQCEPGVFGIDGKKPSRMIESSGHGSLPLATLVDFGGRNAGLTFCMAASWHFKPKFLGDLVLLVYDQAAIHISTFLALKI